jgi:hypothetical protein
MAIQLNLEKLGEYEKDLFKIKRVYKKNDMKEAQKLFTCRKKNRIGTRVSVPTSGVRGGVLKKRQQRCMVKFFYGTKKGAHQKYLEEYMPQKNKEAVLEKPELFGSDIDEYKEHMSDKHFKFIISPERSDINLKVLTETLVQKINTLYGLDVYYQAAAHYDTAHPHVHLLINGVDKNGRDIERFPKDFIKHTLRTMAQDVCTSLAGYRTVEEVRQSKSDLYKSNRFTWLDKAIQASAWKRETKSNAIIFPHDSISVKKRLEYLSAIGLAQHTGGGRYALEAGWDETLKNMGRYNRFLEVWNTYKGSGKPVRVYKGKEELIGIVKKVYTMNDEDTWNNGFVLETEKGVYYIPTLQKTPEQFTGKKVRYRGDSMHGRGKQHGKLNVYDRNV